MATTNVTIRMDTELKKQAEEILGEMGMNMSTAYTVFMKQLVRDRCFPFVPDVKVPSEKLLGAMDEADDILEGRKAAKRYASAKELFEDLDNDV